MNNFHDTFMVFFCSFWSLTAVVTKERVFKNFLGLTVPLTSLLCIECSSRGTVICAGGKSMGRGVWSRKGSC